MWNFPEMSKNILKIKSNPTGSSACKIPVSLFPEEKEALQAVCLPSREHLTPVRHCEGTSAYLSSA